MTAINRLFRPHVASFDLECGAQALQRLSSWWLSDKALAQLAADPNTAALLSSTEVLPGEFIVLFERKDLSSVIAAGFAVPLEWREAPQPDPEDPDRPLDDPRLPGELRKLAGNARRRLRKTSDPTYAARVDRMTLALGRDCPDLSEQRFSCSSAAAAIEAALRCRLAGYAPSTSIAVSAQLGSHGLEPVGGLRAKYEVARRHRIEVLVVAPQQDLSVLATVDGEPRFSRIQQAPLDQQLADIAAHFDAPPYGASRAERFAWYRRAGSTRRDERVKFFASELAPEIAAHLRSGFSPAPIDALVICDTLNHPEMAVLVAKLRDARRILVVTVDASRNRSESSVILALKQHVERAQVTAVAWDRFRGAHANEQALERAVGEEDRVGVDFTTGPKDLAIWLASWHRRRRHRAEAHAKGQATYIQYQPSGAHIDLNSYSLLDLTES